MTLCARGGGRLGDHSSRNTFLMTLQHLPYDSYERPTRHQHSGGESGTVPIATTDCLIFFKGSSGARATVALLVIGRLRFPERKLAVRS